MKRTAFSPRIAAVAWCLVGLSCDGADEMRDSRTSADSLSLVREVVLRGLTDPWDIAFLPDGNFLYTESVGRVGLYLTAERRTQVILETPSDLFYDGKQAGMLGIAVDPEFTRNHYVYTYVTAWIERGALDGVLDSVVMTANEATVRSPSGQFRPENTGYAIRQANGIFAGPATIESYIDRSTVEASRVAKADTSMRIRLHRVENRVVRWVLSPDARTLERDTVIVYGIPYGGQRYGGHNGGRIRFGPDGYLWITTGDGDNATHPQSWTSLGGKVLRVDRDGHAAAGNSARPGADPRIFTRGHRNPQGIAFRRDGRAFLVEHGDDRDDEVNLLVAGGNYGWAPDLLDSAQVDGEPPMTDLVHLPESRQAVWSSGSPTLATSGATFIDNRAGIDWKGWNGVLAIAALKAGRLLVLSIDPSGLVTTRMEALAEYGLRLRSVVQGPDGYLYITTDDFGTLILDPRGYSARPVGEIWRVRPQ